MYLSKRMAIVVGVLAALPVSATTITIEPIARSVGAGRDAVPGRDASFVFWGESDTKPPVINSPGEVAFRAKSASVSNANSGVAFGIYAKRPTAPLAVLVDTTLDVAGNPSFAVPGQPSDTRFLNSLFGAPLINDAGDVVFFASFFGPTAGTGEGLYATTTMGGPIVKIVDTTDPVPGHPTAFFVNFRFVADNLARTAISLNDFGEVVYWAQFCVDATCTSGTNKNGIFGTTVAAALPVLLADSTGTICPTIAPLGITCDPALSQGFWEIRPEKGITNTGDVIFHGKFRRGGSSCCAGVFSIPVTGGIITTAAFRTQPAPPDGTSSFSDRFDEVAHNEAGTVLFLPRLGTSAPARFGVYAGDLSGGPQVRIADTVPGTGPAVPGIPADGEFTSLAFPAMNDSGQMGFRALSNNSVNANTDGIYAADLSGAPIRLVLNTLSQAPGLPAPSRMLTFQEATGASINAEGNLAFAGIGIDHLGKLLQGIYFYDACADVVTRIADSTTSLVDLGGSFGTAGTREFEVYTQGEARAGQYRSMNDSNQVAFTAQFSFSDFGIYVAHVTGAGGGSLTISCPADVTAECPADTTPAATGEPTATGCGTISVSHVDTGAAACGATETLVRTWTADNGAGGTASCVQVISVVDNTPPVLANVPANQTVECDAIPAPASPTATDACDLVPTIANTEVQAGVCRSNSTLTRTWTATDACGNTANATQVITVQDTTPPVATATLTLLGGGDDEDDDEGSDDDEGIFAVGASCSDNCEGLTGCSPTTLSAVLSCSNGVSVAVLPGQAVEIEDEDEGGCEYELENGRLEIEGRVTLTVTCTDASGNVATATAVPVGLAPDNDLETDYDD